MWSLFLILGCRKPVEPVLFDPAAAISLDGDRMDESGREPVRPGAWSTRGWELRVPPGWSGQAGGDPHLLTLVRANGGFELVLSRGSPETGGCTFEDHSRYRTATAFEAAFVATCLTRHGAVRQVWSIQREGEAFTLQAVYPPGRAIEGRQAIQPLLDGLTPVPFTR